MKKQVYQGKGEYDLQFVGDGKAYERTRNCVMSFDNVNTI